MQPSTMELMLYGKTMLIGLSSNDPSIICSHQPCEQVHRALTKQAYGTSSSFPLRHLSNSKCYLSAYTPSTMSGRGIIVDAVTYVETQTTSKTLHCLSNSFNPQDDPPNLEYVVQNQRGRDVVVYVLEQFYSDTDVMALFNCGYILTTTVPQ